MNVALNDCSDTFIISPLNFWLPLERMQLSTTVMSQTQLWEEEPEQLHIPRPPGEVHLKELDYFLLCILMVAKYNLDVQTVRLQTSQHQYDKR